MIIGDNELRDLNHFADNHKVNEEGYCDKCKTTFVVRGNVKDLKDGEPIEPIRQQRTKKDSLMQHLAKMKQEELELDLKLKIIRKQEEIAKKQGKLDVIEQENAYLTELPDKEGYTKLREEKWLRLFEEQVVKLVEIEQAQADGTLKEEEAEEAKKIVTKEIKKLKKLKSNVISRNRMNKFQRGIRKFFKGTATVTKEIGKISDGIGKFGDSVGGGSDMGKATSFEDFFSDQPRGRRTSSPKKRRRKSKSKKGKGKGKKRRRRSKRTQTEPTEQTEPTQSSGAFGGF